MGAEIDLVTRASGTMLARMIEQLGPAAAPAEGGGNGARVALVVVVVVLGVVVVVGRIERVMSSARSPSISSNSPSVPTNRPVMVSRGSWLVTGSGVVLCCPKIAPKDARRNLKDGIIE